MVNFWEMHDIALQAHASGDLDDDEFIVLYEFYKTKNFQFTHWNYLYYDLGGLTNDECWSEFSSARMTYLDCDRPSKYQSRLVCTIHIS